MKRFKHDVCTNQIILKRVSVFTVRKIFIWKKQERVDYCLYYRIDENRFWYSKFYNNKLLDASDYHTTKRDLNGSLEIIEEIKNRYSLFSGMMGVTGTVNGKSFITIDTYSNDENIEIVRRIEERFPYIRNNNTKKKVELGFLK